MKTNEIKFLVILAINNFFISLIGTGNLWIYVPWIICGMILLHMYKHKSIETTIEPAEKETNYQEDSLL